MFDWALTLRLLIVVGMLYRLATDARRVWRRELHASRLGAPTIVLISALLVANHVVPRPLAIAALLTIDVLVLAICVALARAMQETADVTLLPEQKLERVFLRFFPPWLARLASIELTVISHAFIGVQSFISPGQPTSRTYIHGSKLSIVGAIVVLAIIPDALLVWLLLPQALWWLALALVLVEVWACLWIFGVYGTMARRPHILSPEKIVLRNGILQTIELNPMNIVGVRLVGTVKRRELPRHRGNRSTVLGFGGVPFAEITLTRPAVERHLFLSKGRDVERIFVATDMPTALCDELLKSAGYRINDQDTATCA